jgi:hypothetical protein
VRIAEVDRDAGVDPEPGVLRGPVGLDLVRIAAEVGVLDDPLLLLGRLRRLAHVTHGVEFVGGHPRPENPQGRVEIAAFDADETLARR